MGPCVRRDDAESHSKKSGHTALPYLILIASPLKSALAIRRTCRPDSSGTPPFWLVSTIARAPLPELYRL
jgi:hypothetical protein